jgi:hypothetical protein
MSPVKEPHYFGRDVYADWVQQRTQSEYLKLFSGAGTEPIRGEASTSYLYSKTAAAEIHEFNPDARIIVSVRNPGDLLHSLFYHRHYCGKEQAPTVEEALREEQQRKAGMRQSDRTFLGYGPVYGTVPAYASHLRRFLHYFPRGQVYVSIFDDLRDDPQAEYNRITAFLGIEPSAPHVFAVHNDPGGHSTRAAGSGYKSGMPKRFETSAP